VIELNARLRVPRTHEAKGSLLERKFPKISGVLPVAACCRMALQTLVSGMLVLEECFAAL
jgi:hypothetical protein